MTQPVAVGEALRRLSRRFAAAGLASPDLDARILVLEASGLSHAALIAGPDAILAAERLARLETMAARRLARQPVSRILGRREFYGRDFHLSADTLDPRPDTETLVEHVLDWAQAAGRAEAPLRLLDLGTGSGAILLTLLAELPRATGTGSDISSGALRQARLNGERLGLGGRARWVEADWCGGLAGCFDVIVANPPYIPAGALSQLEPEVRLADPLAALDGGGDGLAAYRAIVSGIGRLLAAGGIAALEVGAGQHDDVREIFAATDLKPDPLTRRCSRDLAGRLRVVSFSRPV